MVDLDSLLGHPGALGGEVGWAGPLAPEGCRRLACDGALTRVLVARQPGHPDHPASRRPTTTQPRPGPSRPPPRPRPRPRSCWCSAPPRQSRRPPHQPPTARPGLRRRPTTLARPPTGPGAQDPHRAAGLAGRCNRRWPGCPRPWAAPPASPWRWGGPAGSSSPAARCGALAVGDRGGVFPACARPLAWGEAHHLVHWLDGGPTDLSNLALVCRAHHRAVHEGGWRLGRGPDGRLTATPPHRNHPPQPDRAGAHRSLSRPAEGG
jgi:hypothetical protein